MLYVVCISGTFHETIIYQSFTKKSLDIVLTLAHVLSCEFGKIFKNTFFYRILLVARSGSTIPSFDLHGKFSLRK